MYKEVSERGLGKALKQEVDQGQPQGPWDVTDRVMARVQAVCNMNWVYDRFLKTYAGGRCPYYLLEIDSSCHVQPDVKVGTQN